MCVLMAPLSNAGLIVTQGKLRQQGAHSRPNSPVTKVVVSIVAWAEGCLLEFEGCPLNGDAMWARLEVGASTASGVCRGWVQGVDEQVIIAAAGE